MSLRNRNKRRFFESQPNLFDPAEPEFTVSAPASVSEVDADEILSLDESTLKQPERLRFMSFGSGSSGNCAYIGTKSCGLLIDAGVDNNKVLSALAANAIRPESIQGILLTHDHGDHVRYAYSLLRRNKSWRLYATPKTLNGLLRRHNISRRIKDYHAPIYKEFPFKVGPMTVTAFATSHDGTDNAGFAVDGLGTNFVLVTDTGIVTKEADCYIRKARYLMIESNYDAEMLRVGKYPEHLKARIASETGHLDNAETARYLTSIYSSSDISHIFLCHLSQDNNTPDVALDCISKAFVNIGVKVGDASYSLEDRAAEVHLTALPRLESSPLYVLSNGTAANGGSPR